MPSVSAKQHRAMAAAAAGHSTLGIPESVGKEFVAADSSEEGANTLTCAGILFRAPGDKFLLVKPSNRDTWETPGGHAVMGETPEQAAIRECREEIGVCPAGNRKLLSISKTEEGGQYFIFLQQVSEEFQVSINEEISEAGWRTRDALPENTRSNLLCTLNSITGNEYDFIKGIKDGNISSPQKFGQSWLFDVRITGTGMAYRVRDKEFVFREPNKFLTDEFVDRCNGLLVIFEHPEEKLLNPEEFRDRVIGSIVMPYIKGDEVWGIAKILDEEAAILMQETHISTSPAIYTDPRQSEEINVEGRKVLIEGEPFYLDHLAVCKEGVWDKLEEPSGINLGEKTMEHAAEHPVEVEKEEIVEKTDSEEGMPAWAHQLGKMIVDGIGAHLGAHKADSENMPAPEMVMDSAEEKGDKELKEEEKKADSTPEFKEEFKEMSGKVDSMCGKMDSVKSRVDSVEQALKPLSHEDKNALSAAQARADSVAQLYGESAPNPLFGESPVSYRKRLASKFQKHSKQAGSIKLDSLDGAAFDLIENTIYADAQSSAKTSIADNPGSLVQIVKQRYGGGVMYEYEGDFNAPGAFGSLMPKPMFGHINKKP